MCLVIEPKIRKRLQRRLAKTPRITAWKVVERSRSGLMCSEHQDWYFWRYGWNCSGRKTVDVEASEKIIGVHHGIHVYLREEDAVPYCSSLKVQAVLPVRCSRSDLVAAGWTYNVFDSAVFRKVFVRKADYKATRVALATYQPRNEGDAK